MTDEKTFYKHAQPGPSTLNVEGNAVLVEEIVNREVFECHAEILDIKETREAGEEKRIVRGYANTKDIDRYGDVIEPAAFKASVKQWLKNGVMLLHHNPSKPVGLPRSAKIDDKGLYIEASVGFGNTPDSYIEETWSLIKQGILKAFSVGFRILPGGEKWHDEVDPKSGFKKRTITKLELFETSFVSIGANRQSLFSVVKGMLTGSDAEGSVPNWYSARKIVGIDPEYDINSDILKMISDRRENESDQYKSLDECVARIDQVLKKIRDEHNNENVVRTINKLKSFIGKES